MRVLTAHNHYLISGGEDKSRESEDRLLTNYGHHVDSYTLDNQTIKKLGLFRTAIRTIWSNESYLDIQKRLRETKYDIFHCENTFPLISPSVYYAANAEGVPVVQSLRNYRLLCVNAYLYRNHQVCEDCIGKFLPWPGIVHGCYKGSQLGSAVVAFMLSFHRLLKTYQKHVDIFVVLTEFAKQKFIEAGLPEEKLLIKPNFVDPDPKIGEGKGGFALFVGRLSEEKGLHLLLQSWQTLSKHIPLKIVGDGPLLKYVQDCIHRIPGIEYLGRKTTQEIYQLMGQAKALILPSQWYEGFPRVIIEAYAKGTPIIASKLGAMQTAIDHQRTGLHFTPGSSTELVQQVEWMLSYPLEWQAMRREARSEFEAKYTADRNYDRLMEIYQLAIERVKRC